MNVEEYRKQMNAGITNPEHRAANDAWLNKMMSMLKPGGMLVTSAGITRAAGTATKSKGNKAKRKAAKQARRANRK